jgi:hypothetical protein
MKQTASPSLADALQSEKKPDIPACRRVNQNGAEIP